MDQERVFHMADADLVARDQHPDDIKPGDLTGPPVAVDPGEGRTDQLVSFLPVDRFHRIAKMGPRSCLYLDESHQFVALRDEVDIPVAGPVPALQHGPAPGLEPSLRYPLSLQPELHCLLGHGAKLSSRVTDASSWERGGKQFCARGTGYGTLGPQPRTSYPVPR
jgi:hypothetical protein